MSQLLRNKAHMGINYRKWIPFVFTDRLPAGHVQVAQAPSRHEPDDEGQVDYGRVFALLKEEGILPSVLDTILNQNNVSNTLSLIFRDEFGPSHWEQYLHKVCCQKTACRNLCIRAFRTVFMCLRLEYIFSGTCSDIVNEDVRVKPIILPNFFSCRCLTSEALRAPNHRFFRCNESKSHLDGRSALRKLAVKLYI